MSRYSISLLLLLALLAGGCDRPPEEPPDILLISLDTCRSDHLGCYGYARRTSPFLDRLTGRGVLFANSAINSHGTTPSHTTLLSSLFQENHQVEFGHDEETLALTRIPPGAVMLQQLLDEAGYTTLAVTGGGRMSSKFGFERGFEFYGDNYDLESGSRRLVELIEERRRPEGPTFAFLHTYEIHGPYLPPAEHAALFGAPEAGFETTIESLRRFKSRARRLSREDLDCIVARYDGGIHYSDLLLQRLFGELERIGFLENCLIVITADHGEEFAEHGGLLHRGVLYEEMLAVPLLFIGPGLPRGVVDRRPVSSIDVAVTILGRLGRPALPEMKGRDLFAGSRGEDPEQSARFAQYGGSRYAVSAGSWKLIQTVRSGKLELYNMESDPRERRNLVHRRPQRVVELKARLDRWRAGQETVQSGEAETAVFEPEELELLKQLGYVYEEGESASATPGGE